MTTQSEYVLETDLIAQLQRLGYNNVVIKDETDLVANLKTQLETHNGITITATEFKQVLNQLNKGNIFEKAKTLRDKIAYTKDDGTTGYLELINQIHWCKNQYQVAHQIKIMGKYENRYDVTLLVNGLPLVQIELKRRGVELKGAFNQIDRYGKHSYHSGFGLFGYIQLFVISNGVNTKYYANNPIGKEQPSFKQTFYWADTDNKIITQLEDFATVFLEPCHLSKMITKYIVLNETDNKLMVLRPYQYYATEAIVDRVKTGNKFGYIWHTTGSGKTLTSFKTSQILTNLDEVYKVVFVVDRKDLDYQTIKEFSSFSEGSIDGTNNTAALVKQFADDTKLIVTTIQKLNTAIVKQAYLKRMDALKDKRIVFIFDECHRSQFGDTHKRIKEYFNNAQMFGFTGTPIFKPNAAKNEHGKRTTKDLFEDCLHKYVITDAIRDNNVLKFSIEYISTFKGKDEVIDIGVDDIDKTEVMEAPQRLNAITDYIINNHARKTHNKAFTAIFCVQDVKTLIKYYDLFKAKKEEGKHNLKVATIFSYNPNEDPEANDTGNIPDEDFNPAAQQGQDSKHSLDKLESYIADYNSMFTTNHSVKDFYNYYQNIAKRVKDKEVDILLVVNMFLTGFDSKTLNTIYVDKNLKYHGLIQAYSRTNRILNELKSQGNVVCFRNLKSATDEAIELFANKEAIEVIMLKPYKDYIALFETAVHKLLEITPTVDSVNELYSEKEILEFVTAFRELMRLKNVLGSFTEFTFEDLPISAQDFEDYKGKYLDIKDSVKKNKEKVSILNDIDFELELIHRDEINVVYILTLLVKLKENTDIKEQDRQRKAIIDMLGTEIQLRSKKELIERFIQENLPFISDTNTLNDEFDRFWTIEKIKAMNAIATSENLDSDKLEKVIGNYLFTQKLPLRDEVIAIMNVRPALKDRATTSERVTTKIVDFVETFINSMG